MKRTRTTASTSVSQLCAAMHHQVPNALGGILTVALLVVGLEAYFKLNIDLTYWIVTVVSILGLRLALFVMYRRRIVELRASDWITLQSILALSLAALFAYAGVQLMQANSIVVTAVVSTILYGLATGAIPILGMVHSWYLMYVVTLLTPVIVHHLSRPDDPSSAVFAVCGVILIAVLMAVSKNYARAVSRGYLSDRDPLTNCSNRRLVDRTLSSNRMPSGMRPGALAMLDLDRFKTINDTAGHEAGDRVLIDLANTLRDLTDEHDEVCRLGGDEFAILFSERSMVDLDATLEGIRETLAEKRFHWGQNVFRITASLGLVAFTDEVPCDSEAMAKADMAAYVAKKKGGNRIIQFSRDNPDLIEDQLDLKWRARVENALETGQMVLACQEIHRVNGDPSTMLPGSNQVALELLVRLRDGSELIPATEFVPAVERLGLSSNLDRWVVANAFLWAHENKEALQTIDWVSINLSINTISDTGFFELVDRLTTLYELDSGKIIFELTEHEAILDYVNVVRFMERLSRLGFGFALDDFGTGYSSLQYLKDLSVDFVKVDKAFVTDITQHCVDRSMLLAINQLCQSLGKTVIAEGVESEDTLATITELGVDYIQGHLIQAPEQLDDWTEAWLRGERAIHGTHQNLRVPRHSVRAG